MSQSGTAWLFSNDVWQAFAEGDKNNNMLRLESKVKVGGYTFRGVCEVEVVSGWEDQTDTCSIKLPRKLRWEGKALVAGSEPLLKRGMEVEIHLGYDGRLHRVFVGYLRSVGSDTPVTLQCEDLMYKLKTGEVTTSHKRISLEALIKEVCKVPLGFVASAELGSFRITKASPAKVLDYLKEHYHIRSWCRDGKLNVGVAYLSEGGKTHRIRFQRNVIEHSLEYRLRDDVELLLKGVIMDGKGKKETVEYGVEGGEQHTFHYTRRSKVAVLEQLEKEAERLRYTGYRGSFTTFGEPFIRHGDIVELLDDDYPERQGKYLVKKVISSFGQNGYRQQIELESKTA